MDLMKKQDLLQNEAYEVLEELDLLKMLKQFGEPYLVGSADLGLMTWRDIDFEIIVGTLNKSEVLKVVTALLEKTRLRMDITFSDNHDDLEPDRIPRGIYLGVKYYGKIESGERILSGNKNTWKIDLWFVDEGSARSHRNTEEIKQKLDEEKKRIILEIKEQIADHPKYRYEIFSTDIYSAVLDNKVSNLGEFKEYIRKMGKELD